MISNSRYMTPCRSCYPSFTLSSPFAMGSLLRTDEVVPRADTASYVDFTHDTQFALILPTLNLTSFAESGPLPSDHIPKHRTFVSSEIMPFATNMQIQVLTCSAAGGKNGKAHNDEEDEDDDEDEKPNGAEDQDMGKRRRAGAEKEIRIVLNDGVVPLTGIRGCPEDEDGLCPLDTFVQSVRELVDETDFAAVCRGRTVDQNQAQMPDSVSKDEDIEQGQSRL